VLELGLIKRIGDGTSTNIWNDRLIPNGVGFKPVCRKTQDVATAERVCDLFSQVGRSYDAVTLIEKMSESPRVPVSPPASPASVGGYSPTVPSSLNPSAPRPLPPSPLSAPKDLQSSMRMCRTGCCLVHLPPKV
jgi:hypothetical protein